MSQNKDGMGVDMESEDRERVRVRAWDAHRGWDGG
jgi:hypothetical protein